MKWTPILFGSVFALLIFFVSCAGDANKKQNAERKSSVILSSLAENDSIGVSGILICTHCYALNKSNVGLNHELPKSGFVENCARLCAQQNYPIGVLCDTAQYGSQVWVIRTSSQLFTDYMSNATRITGSFVKDALIEPAQIEVMERGEWIRLQ